MNIDKPPTNEEVIKNLNSLNDFLLETMVDRNRFIKILEEENVKLKEENEKLKKENEFFMINTPNFPKSKDLKDIETLRILNSEKNTIIFGLEEENRQLKMKLARIEQIMKVGL